MREKVRERDPSVSGVCGKRGRVREGGGTHKTHPNTQQHTHTHTHTHRAHNNATHNHHTQQHIATHNNMQQHTPHTHCNTPIKALFCPAQAFCNTAKSVLLIPSYIRTPLCVCVTRCLVCCCCVLCECCAGGVVVLVLLWCVMCGSGCGVRVYV